jgi:hypothetical protein
MPDDTQMDEFDGGEEFPDIEAEFGGSGSTVDYRCTEEELAEGGFADGFSTRIIDDMPEHESEFIGRPITDAELDAVMDAPFRATRAMLESVERRDWTEMPGVGRLVDLLTSDMMGPLPAVPRPAP